MTGFCGWTTSIQTARSTYPLDIPCWCCVIFVVSVRSAILVVSDKYMFYEVRLSASRPTPNLEDQDILFCPGQHLLPIRLVMPYSSNTTASTALTIIWPRKPHHYVKVGIPFGGLYNTYKKVSISQILKIKHCIWKAPSGETVTWRRHQWETFL